MFLTCQRQNCTYLFLPGFSSVPVFHSEQDPAGSNPPGIARDGTGRATVSTACYRTGLNHHGILRDCLHKINISWDCTGRDFTGRKRHEIARDEISREEKNMAYPTGRDLNTAEF